MKGLELLPLGLAYMFIVYAGTCTGVVVNTGDNTVMGRIARLAGSIVEESEPVFRKYQ